MKREILLYLGKKRGWYYYGIHKDLCQTTKYRFWLSQVWRALRSLESKRFIRSHDGRRKLEGQKKGPYYYITILGLLKILTYDVSLAEIGLIMKKNADRVPLIFNEWDYFEQKGVTQKIVFAMRFFYVSYVMDGMFAVPSPFKPRKGLLRQQHWLLPRPKLNGAVLTRYVLFHYLPLLTLSRFEATEPIGKRVLENCRRISFEWVRIWSENPRLRKYLIEQLARKEKMTENVLMRIREVEDYIKRR